MAYSSANSEVIALTGFNSVYSSSSAPTLTQVTDIISQVDGEIDTALYALGITSTPTNTTLLKYLAKYSAMGSAGLTLIRYKTPEGNDSQGTWLYNEYKEWINKLITDKTYQTMITGIGVSSYTGNYVSSNVKDGTHAGVSAGSTEISYGVDGFKI